MQELQRILGFAGPGSGRLSVDQKRQIRRWNDLKQRADESAGERPVQWKVRQFVVNVAIENHHVRVRFVGPCCKKAQAHAVGRVHEKTHERDGPRFHVLVTPVYRLIRSANAQLSSEGLVTSVFPVA